MKFAIQYLSFFVIQNDGSSDQEHARRYKHYQTLDHAGYEGSEIKSSSSSRNWS